MQQQQRQGRNLLQATTALFRPCLIDVLIELNMVSNDKVTKFCAIGLTAKEVIVRLSTIKEQELRDALAQCVLPLVIDSNKNVPPSTTVVEKFHVSYIDRLLCNEQQNQRNNSDSLISSIYFASGVLRCNPNKKYDLLVAYYVSSTPLLLKDLSTAFQWGYDTKQKIIESSATICANLHNEICDTWQQYSTQKLMIEGAKQEQSESEKNSDELDKIRKISDFSNDNILHFFLQASTLDELIDKIGDFTSTEIQEALLCQITRLKEERFLDNFIIEISYTDDLIDEKQNGKMFPIYFIQGILRRKTEGEYWELPFVYFESTQLVPQAIVRDLYRSNTAVFTNIKEIAMKKLINKLYQRI